MSTTVLGVQLVGDCCEFPQAATCECNFTFVKEDNVTRERGGQRGFTQRRCDTS